jgi:thiamine-monophosphate kinase
MAIAEFDLIRRFFNLQPPRHPCNKLGIGDDCALLSIPAGFEMALTTDTMVENVHFFTDVDPQALGHKLLAVNLSDLAAMGAEPFAVTLALTLPRVDEDWLQAFSSGFLQLARLHHVDLIGGDTTSGPLTLTVQAMGLVPQGRALLRSGAKVGDLIYVTGQLGNAGLGLKIRQGVWQQHSELALLQFDRPMPRIAEGLELRDAASACIDISDGLAADLGHILAQSQVGAVVDWERLPLSADVQHYVQSSGDWSLPLIAGDDYQLCFTVPADFRGQLPADCHCIGRIEAEMGLRIKREGQFLILEATGFEHFS